MSSEGLDVRAVIDRFDASEQTLAELRERLRSIVLAEEGATDATQHLQGASRSLGALVPELQRVTAELESVRRTTVDALEAAREFLSGTDLGSLRGEVAAVSDTNREELAALRTDLAAVAEATTAGVNAVRWDIKTLAESVPTVAALQTENAALRATLSGRQRKQLGLE